MFIEDKLRKEGGHIGVLLIKLQVTLASSQEVKMRTELCGYFYIQELTEKMPLNLRLLFHHS